MASPRPIHASGTICRAEKIECPLKASGEPHFESLEAFADYQADLNGVDSDGRRILQDLARAGEKPANLKVLAQGGELSSVAKPLRKSEASAQPRKVSPETQARYDESVAAVRRFHSEVLYPSPADPRLKALNAERREAHEALVNERYDIPKDWTVRTSYLGGVSFIPQKAKRGPNGDLLEVSPKLPTTKRELPAEGLYLQTSAGFYVGGPYETPKEAEEASRSYSGPDNPGIAGRD